MAEAIGIDDMTGDGVPDSLDPGRPDLVSGRVEVVAGLP